MELTPLGAPPDMVKRLEQIAALVVAAGLAITSYWLFFSWAQGGGAHRRDLPLPAGRSDRSAAITSSLHG
ncbi:MAG: hypothetical protein VKI83_01375 [Synechococcaceae cyanobacterium]|nr:hypothetical protein [Synechococcaceae cyanobacterium]